MKEDVRNLKREGKNVMTSVVVNEGIFEKRLYREEQEGKRK